MRADWHRNLEVIGRRLDELAALKAQATRSLDRLASDGQTPCDDTDCGDLLRIEQRKLAALVG